MKYKLRVPFYVSGNGYIEGRELDDFLREFVSSVSLTDVGPEVSPRAKQLFLNEARIIWNCTSSVSNVYRQVAREGARGS